MQNNSRDLRLISFNKYVRPEIKEYKHKGYVLNGVNNSFYNYLTECYYGSTTHKAVCDTYINLIYGQGLVETDGDVESAEWLAFLEIFSEEDQHRIISDFKIYGEFSAQVIPTRGKTLSKILHLEKSKVVPSVADDLGNITSYWYSKDWSKQWQQGYEPVEYPAMGHGKGNETEIFVGKPYNVGKEYFSDPDYLPILPYAEFEQEVANYYLKYIKNGLSLGNIVNVPNSQHWSSEEKDKYEKKVKERLTGSDNANQVLISFNGADTSPSTIESIKNDYAHKQWDFLTVEARQQILTGHKATSPSLVGVISSSGFSNTADEMDEAEHQLMKRVIAPYQNFLIRSIRQILKHYKIDRELSFIPLTEKNEETTVDENVVVKEDVKEEVKEDIELSSDCNCQKKKFSSQTLIDLGEEENLLGYNVVLESEVDYNEKIDFASTGTARPNSKSKQDSDDIVIRYKYVGNKTPERGFCRDMMRAGKVYRKEDIVQMEKLPVNPGFGLNGTDTYSIWKWKGGGRMSGTFPNGTCKHKWNRVIYLKNGKSIDVNSPLAKMISTTKARAKGYKVPTNENEVSIAPHDMK